MPLRITLPPKTDRQQTGLSSELSSGGHVVRKHCPGGNIQILCQDYVQTPGTLASETPDLNVSISLRAPENTYAC